MEAAEKDGHNVVFQEINKEILSHTNLYKICYDLIDAVRYLHEKDITHNDIKVENILFLNKNDLKLTDF